MSTIVETSWWLDWSALPERVLWARLRVCSNGAAEILDLDGRCHRFDSRTDAVLWLNEDEYSLLADLIEDGEVGIDIVPPHAENDEFLVPLMSVIRKSPD